MELLNLFIFNLFVMLAKVSRFVSEDFSESERNRTLDAMKACDMSCIQDLLQFWEEQVNYYLRKQIGVYFIAVLRQILRSLVDYHHKKELKYMNFVVVQDYPVVHLVVRANEYQKYRNQLQKVDT